MAKRNPQDATLRNVRAQHKTDFKQDVRIQSVKQRSDKRDSVQNTRIERLEDVVTALTLRVEKLERDVNNPLGLRT